MWDSLLPGFSGANLIPHGYCISWNPSLLWTFVLSDSLIAASYFSIPFALWYFARKRPDIPQRWLMLLFGMFIIACGITHLLDVMNIWSPIYWVNALSRIVTAGLSLGTAIILWRIMPAALQAPSASQLEEAHHKLEKSHAELEQRVQERTRDLANALEQAQLLQQELEQKANIDFLTGINNRGHFMNLAETELARAKRYGSTPSFFMMDIDHFKRINDTHGHKAGDLVLKKLAEICLHELREVDIIGRVGGEEFAVLLPETDKEMATEVAERLRLAIEHAQVGIGSGAPIRFTVSIGIASVASMEESLDILLMQADKALYEAKHAGRNRICVAS
jgi:diguanylate cyclase (GGDEF)-like protein